MNKKIIFTAGGTGGHILPALNLMKHFFEKGYSVLLITDKRGKFFINNYSHFKSYVLTAGTTTNKKLFYKIYYFLVIFYSLIKSIIILKKEKADLVIGFGGYTSFPICFASKLFNIPLVIYENNLILGRTNRFLLKIAKKIFLADIIKKDFPKKYENKISKVGHILSKSILNLSNFKKNNNKKNFTILVLGGSQGAEVFGRVVPPVIKMIKEEGYEIEINQQSTKNRKNFIEEYYKKNKIKNYIFEFENNIFKLMMSSDLAITRGGASSTAELVNTFTPFITVPLPHSVDNHQYLNAEFYHKKNYCWILEQKNFSEKNLYNLIKEIIKNKNKLEFIQENMRKNIKNNVYSVIENEVKKII
jgi:UDP-N-acetylglucosamine--N-acetylmuramyl-(pentapeptide) pyrophosphoryl-undecaprenol N-acetylglucosamine transferase